MASRPWELVALPEELLLAVLDYIDADDLSTFRALNGTNRRLRRLTTDRLYRNYPGFHPEQFLRTIVLSPPTERPELANDVREVSWHQSHWTKPSRRRGLALGDRHLVANRLRSSGCILNTTDLSMDLPGRFIGFSSEYEAHWWYLEFFLFFTPRVEKLLVWDVWQWDDHSYWFESLSANPAHFAHLSSITLYGPLRLENIVPLLTLPSIRNLGLTQVINMRREPGRNFAWTEGRDDYISGRLAAGCSVEVLSMRESDIFFPQAMTILENLNKIKSLTYEHIPNELTSDSGQLGGFLNINELQRFPESSLSHLRIRSETFLADGEVSSLWSPRVHLPEKHPFRNLRTLDIGPCNVASFTNTSFIFSGDKDKDPRELVDQFPATLETLQIKWAYGHDVETRFRLFLTFLRSIAEAIASSSSSLKRIAIVEWPALAGWVPLQDEVTSLKKTYDGLGIEFDVVYDEVDGQEPLETRGDVEPGWLWVDRTESFDRHAAIPERY